MSAVSDSYFDEDLTLIDRSTGAVVSIQNNANRGNLVEYRLSAIYNDTINEVTKNGQVTLRALDGLFDSIDGPILTDENTKAEYLIETKLRQEWRGTAENTPVPFRDNRI